MRRIIAMALALMLCGVALAETVPGNRLGLALLSDLSGGTQNAFISPIGVAWGLSMAAQGGGGETRQRLLKALDADDPDAVAALGETLTEAGLRWANALFARPGLKLSEEYVGKLASLYGAECFELGAGTEADAWVSAQTDGLIDGLPTPESVEDAQLILLNAVAMDAQWASPFAPEDTWEDDFHTPDGDVRVPFMHQQAFVLYGESMGMRFIQKNYWGGRLAMMIALPNNGQLKSALTSLKKSGMNCFTFKANPVSVSLSLPKLDCEYDASLEKPISAAGYWVPFSPEYADYSGISDERLTLTGVSQRLRVRVDEDGTRAAAATQADFAKSAPHLEDGQPVELNLNKPFLFIIFDRESGVICFAGAVVDPLG